MRRITDVTNLKLHKTAVALGKFDGFHLGHQVLFRQVQKWQEEGLTGVIFTFVPAGEKLGADKHIDSPDEKRKKAEATGIDILLEYPFTKAFAGLEPEKFVRDILVNQLDVQAVVVGRDFRFGRNRRGDAALLEALGKTYGFQVRIIEKLTKGHTEISSSVIRKAVETGDMEQAAAYLGQSYRICGTVIHGKGLGHTIQIPTANLSIDKDKILPPFGVYASKVIWKGQAYLGVSNLGCKPTVSQEHQIGLETYLFAFCEDIYGEELQVELLHFIRPELEFSSLHELTEQMKKDMEAAKSFFLQFT